MSTPKSPIVSVIATATDCPDCGSNGPHDVYRYMGQDEFVCANCGMQHACPQDEPDDDADDDDAADLHEVYRA